MASLRKRENLVILIVLVCVVSLFVSGCSLIQEDGEDRHALRLRSELSLFGGPTNTRIVTDHTEETHQGSRKPSIRETEIQMALIKEGLGDKVADALSQ